MKLEHLGLVRSNPGLGASMVLLAASGLAALGGPAGCTTSEPLDLPAQQDARGSAAGDGGGTGGTAAPSAGAGGGVTGVAGHTAPGLAGTTGTTGGAGITGAAGRIGAAGTAGTAGAGGAAGRGGPGGTAGSTGRGGTGGGASLDGDGGTATFTRVYDQVVNVYCDGALCHNPGSQRGVGFASKTSAYNYLRGQVQVGDPESSYFYYIMTSSPRFMPPVGEPGPTQADLALVSAWIGAGARND